MRFKLNSASGRKYSSKTLDAVYDADDYIIINDIETLMKIMEEINQDVIIERSYDTNEDKMIKTIMIYDSWIE